MMTLHFIRFTASAIQLTRYSVKAVSVLMIAAIIACGGKLRAQADTLVLDEAVSAALQSNFRIAVAKNDARVSRNFATKGNAGLLPGLDLSVTDNYTIGTRKSTLADGRIIEGVNAESNSFNASAGVTYSLFNGFANKTSYQKLLGNVRLSEVQSRLETENTIAKVINTYLETYRLQEALKISEQTLQISKERYERLEAKGNYGQSSSIDLLNSLVDLNTDSMNFLDARLNLENSKRELNFLMGLSPEQTGYVTHLIPEPSEIVKEELARQATAQNANILVAYQTLRNAEYDRKIAVGRALPSLDANAGYSFSRIDQEASFQLNSVSYGPTVGLALNFSIFDGGRKQIQIQNAKIAIESSRILQQEAELLIEKDVHNVWAAYEKNKTVAATQRENVKIAKANFERTNELYKMGLVTTTQFREAQLNLLRVENILLNAETELTANEFEMMRLAGFLIKEH